MNKEALLPGSYDHVKELLEEFLGEDKSSNDNSVGIKEINGDPVVVIDGVPTLIKEIHGDYACGSIVNDDLSLKPCFVARVGSYYAHGDTLHAAVTDARNKALSNLPIERRIESVKNKYPDPEVKVDGEELFSLHNMLTGSCRAGRLSWCENHNLDPSKDKLTIHEFCQLTCNDYGGEVIQKLAASYKIKL